MKFKLKQRKVPNSFLSTRFNDPYKRQGDLYRRVVGNSWVIQKISTKVMAFTLIVGKSQKSYVTWKLIAGPKKRVIHLLKVAGCWRKSPAKIGRLLCLAFLYGWHFLNIKISLDWPLTLTTQPSTSKLSDNPESSGPGQLDFLPMQVHVQYTVVPVTFHACFICPMGNCQANNLLNKSWTISCI